MDINPRNLKLAYFNQRFKAKTIFKKTLSVNNIRSLKSKISSQIKTKNVEFNSDRNMKIETSSKEKIKLPKMHLYKRIKNDIKSKLLEIKNGNFFVTDENRIYVNKNKLNKSKHKTKSDKKDKDEEFKLNFDSLISKFDEEYIVNAILNKNKQRNKLNKIYGITSAYINKLNAAKRKKYLTLKDYQSNILKAYSFNEKNSDKSINQLSKKFDELREEIESIPPLPKINIKTIINHIKNKPKKEKIVSVKNYINKVNEPKDAFEKEEQLIYSLRLKRNNFSKLKYKSITSF